MNIKYKWQMSDKMIWASIVYHLVVGFLILKIPTIRHVTGSFVISQLFESYDWVFYILTSLASIFGLVIRGVKNVFFPVCMLLPQQFFLLIAFCGQVYAISRGTYPDGYSPIGGPYFLFIDQFPSMVMCIAHSLIIIEKWTLTIKLWKLQH